MTTIVNNPGASGSGDSGAGLIIGVIIAIVLIVLFFVYALPAIRERNNGTTNINIEVPKLDTTSNSPSN
ncbi:MAG: hypothetical protein UT65_C0003G0019 [Parcubacteria group bacterium GW2011_GWF2_39_8b]|uniref:Uncharacterized protein n=3 Tax=Candidatus Zambryskiibacteriota TaxID=1817925 RepID=A0A1G2T848_9BACT|nr:MAG: hypothetical protein UT65_C0003G0019 [Parcubacteria group bacterium GW2011_GWF2_39_8b]KKR45244.1 MAG: hypothetical protein UT81_C0018G0006 [Parcubacteria group bacterium GW2011_GWA2_40_14]OHA93457.1 MAG: hypothetical protein A2W58_02395 [Candidatus Zambryskibacteria bacterium RIFCSPHIGHO2_02_38_10.5]OHA95983.1 MAG: hypothetical protein A3C63_02160 [Candidatus Zambryskibacteria bacterium RIFCSPHIGHO2_02_FULL_39_82]OHA97708.1 MAG: hypothetical protein A3E32_00515 [Candidatus Zambryskibact